MCVQIFLGDQGRVSGHAGAGLFEGRTGVGNTVLFPCGHCALRLGEFGGRNHLHRLYQTPSQYHPALPHAKATYLGDFLNVSDRLEPQLDFAQGSHISGILGSSTLTVSLLCGEASDGLPGKHRQECKCLSKRSHHSENIGHQRAESKIPLPKLARRLKFSASTPLDARRWQSDSILITSGPASSLTTTLTWRQKSLYSTPR